jgi:hypothetical protein
VHDRGSFCGTSSSPDSSPHLIFASSELGTTLRRAPSVLAHDTCKFVHLLQKKFRGRLSARFRKRSSLADTFSSTSPARPFSIPGPLPHFSCDLSNGYRCSFTCAALVACAVTYTHQQRAGFHTKVRKALQFEHEMCRSLIFQAESP